jgi:hypothetical protein
MLTNMKNMVKEVISMVERWYTVEKTTAMIM